MSFECPCSTHSLGVSAAERPLRSQPSSSSVGGIARSAGHQKSISYFKGGVGGEQDGVLWSGMECCGGREREEEYITTAPLPSLANAAVAACCCCCCCCCCFPFCNCILIAPGLAGAVGGAGCGAGRALAARGPPGTSSLKE